MDTLRFYMVTWNVATKSPGQDLNSLLDFPSQYNKNKPLPDFYVIGLQEVKSQPQNMLMDSLFSDPWTAMLNKILCRQGYITAKSIRLQGILLLVYTQMKHVTHLREIEAQYTKTGLGGMWGNKGAVSVRFNIYGCSVSLVNCHLAAHEHLLAERISDYNTIIKNHEYHVRETSNILYHDYVFWLGDLNFRTDHPSGSSPTSEEIVAQLHKIEKDKYTALLKHDQLFAVMESGEAFSEFREAEIRFPPTYKFNIGTDDYDIKRKPSWTDRILYKVIANNYENITLKADLVSYNHLPHYTVSDHKPVIGLFKIKIRHGFIRALIEKEEKSRAPRSAVRMRSAIVAPAQIESRLGSESRYDDVNCACPPGVSMMAAGLMDAGAGTTSGVEEVDAPGEQVFANYTVKTVEFAPIDRTWFIGDYDFRTQCTLSPDVEIYANDWIGIYDANLQSLDDYIAYEYLSKVGLPAPALPGRPRTIALNFCVGSGVRSPGFYRFIYFSQPNHDVRSVLGISDPFEVRSYEDKLVTIGAAAEAPCSSSSPNKPTTATSDIFTDFTGLDVASLSRHFSNDLSID